jgi:hypothetical protein
VPLGKVGVVGPIPVSRRRRKQQMAGEGSTKLTGQGLGALSCDHCR